MKNMRWAAQVLLWTIASLFLFTPSSHADAPELFSVVFSDTGKTSVRSNRLVGQSATNPFRVGVTNFGNDVGGTEPGAQADYSTILGGNGNSSLDVYAVSGGYYSVASGWASFAVGNWTHAGGRSSHAEGHSTSAKGEAAHAEGWYGLARQKYSHVEGSACVTGIDETDAANAGLSFAGHAEGAGTLAGGGIGPHSEGYGTIASGNGAHSEGVWTRATMPAAHAEGEDCEANAWRSHAEGAWTHTYGIASHSEGLATKAVGQAASSHGDSSVALRDSQWSLAGGNFHDDSNASTVPPAARGDSQTSLIILRAQSLAGEPVQFRYGTSRNQYFAVEEGKSYDIRSSALLAGTVNGTRTTRLITTHALVSCCNNGTPSVNVIDELTTGDSSSSGWQVQLSSNNVRWVLWNVIPTPGSVVNGVLRVEFTEVLFP